ncbi:MAG: hypothetical protein CL609_19360 [Anaerolineaceae bacterium]|nr:hypothetical protein [Anaerolineaceae bacterium]
MINSISYLHLVWLIPVTYIIAVFINHSADVLPEFRTLRTKPVCLKCKQTFDFFNYSTFKQCHHCNTKRPLRQTVVVVLMPLFLISSFYYLGNVFQWIVAAIILTYLAILFLIDLEHRLILHPTSIVGAILFIFIGVFRNGILKTLLGGLSGFVIMFLLYLFGILFNRWMSKRKGEIIDEAALGYGDVNLSGVLGLLLGWPGIGLCLFFAIIGGGVFSGLWLLFMLIRKKYEAFTPIPYAPFLIISAIFILFLSTTN